MFVQGRENKTLLLRYATEGQIPPIATGLETTNSIHQLVLYFSKV